MWLFQVHFSSGESKNLYMNIANTEKISLTDNAELNIERSSRGIRAYVYGQFNAKPVLNDSSTSRLRGRCFTWSDITNNVIEFKYSVSFISPENARRSLSEEIPGWSFESFKDNAKKTWEKSLTRSR